MQVSFASDARNETAHHRLDSIQHLKISESFECVNVIDNNMICWVVGEVEKLDFMKHFIMVNVYMG
jgi:hypothetical protein